jgi:hypothetical protein
MDHLELPRRPMHPPISIPYLSVEPYDGEDFETYSGRKGWTTSDIEGSGACTKSLDERAAFLQAWLFFGLLKTFLGDGFNEQDYVMTCPQKPSVVTLSKVQDRLSRLRPANAADVDQLESLVEATSLQPDHQQFDALTQDDIAATSSHNGHDDKTRIARILDFAHNVNVRALYFGPYNHDLDLICLSVAALGELLSVHLGILDDDMWLRSSSNNFLFQRMIDDGWCPVEIIRLGKMSTVGQLYYISNMDRPGPQRSHKDCVQRVPLGGATTEGVFARSLDDRLICTAYQMNWQTYTTKHVQGCGTCDELLADQALMEDILGKGFFPLLMPASTASHDSCGHGEGLEDKISAPPEGLKIVSSEFYGKYVCISHVWSDGLGNPHSNSIPQCQYRRLSAMTHALYPNEDVPFWIDTISVPRAPVDIRRRAIMLMRKTYWDADCILVLDSYLLDVDPHTVPEKEVWLRLLCCGWTRRLWTLQESALAKDIFLQLKDGFLNIDQCLTCATDTGNDILTLEWMKLRGAWERWASDLENWKQQLLSTLSDAVAWRATSIAEDEAICLGNLTGLDPSSVEQILILTTHEDRMVKFWELQQTLFTGILFWGGPRIQKFPYRWAPSSFLNQGPAGFLASQTNKFSPAQSCDTGLRFRLPGVRLGRWRKSFRPSVFVRTGVHRWYRLTSDMDRIVSPTEETVLGAIFQESDPLFIEQLPPGGSMAALIVSLLQVEEGDGCIYAKPECLATLERADNAKGWVEPLEKLYSRFYSATRPNEASGAKIQLSGTSLGHVNADPATGSDILAIWIDGQLALDLEDRHIMFEATVLSNDQEWCVG